MAERWDVSLPGRSGCTFVDKELSTRKTPSRELSSAVFRISDLCAVKMLLQVRLGHQELNVRSWGPQDAHICLYGAGWMSVSSWVW